MCAAGKATLGCASRPNATFRFGAQYTHFWYTLSPRPPFRLLGLSGEFCLAMGLGAEECESVQFISGLVGSSTRVSADQAAGAVSAVEEHNVILSWGANDCEAKVGHVSLALVWDALKPPPGSPAGGMPCEWV